MERAMEQSRTLDNVRATKRRVRLAYDQLEGQVHQVHSPDDVLRYYGTYVETDTAQEHFVVVYMDQRSDVIGSGLISVGGKSSTLVDTVLILGTALHLQADGLILIHNHPSRRPGPSNEDIALTQRIKAQCELLGLTLQDHIIITTEHEKLKTYSMRAMGTEPFAK